MATKDPFSHIPDLDDRDNEHDYEREEDVDTKGGAPRNFSKSLSKFGVPIAVIAIVVWLFMPQPDPHRKAKSTEYELDETRQAASTAALVQSLLEDANAKKPPEKKVELTPVIPSELAPSELQDKADAEKLKQDEEIRASALEAGRFTLVSDKERSAVPASQNLVMLQQDLMDQQRNAAEKQAAAQQKLLASLQKEDVKSKGASVDFLQEQAAGNSGATSLTHQQPSSAHLIINQGTVVRTVLLTAVNSDMPGTITAKVTSDVYDSTYMNHVLIPRGSTLIGAYNSQVSVGQERVLIAMNRLILPNGSWVALSGAPAADVSGQSGLGAEVNNHFVKMFLSSAIVGASSALLPSSKNTVTTTNTGGGITTAGNTLAIALNEVLKNLLDRNKNISPTLTLEPGKEFIFMVAKDVEMKPYR